MLAGRIESALRSVLLQLTPTLDRQEMERRIHEAASEIADAVLDEVYPRSAEDE